MVFLLWLQVAFINWSCPIFLLLQCKCNWMHVYSYGLVHVIISVKRYINYFVACLWASHIMTRILTQVETTDAWGHEFIYFTNGQTQVINILHAIFQYSIANVDSITV
jgi:hypothetical protein